VQHTEVAIVGGGIAGIGAAFELSKTHDVVVLERESTLTAHSTGRSAAVLVPGLGGRAFSALTEASQSLFDAPPTGFSDAPLLTHRGLVNLLGTGDSDMANTSTSNRRDAHTERLSTTEVMKLTNWVNPEVIDGALYQHNVDEIDVLALHQGYVRGARANGVTILRSNEAVEFTRRNNSWVISTPDDSVTCQIVVNAGGAWADVIGVRCGARAVGLQPKRRTAFTVSAPGVSGGPMIGDAAFTFYAKPEPGDQLLMSPLDEDPVEPCDVRHEEETVALTLDRANPWVIPELRHVRTAWAGLRTFAPDEHPVIGWDPDVDGLFWFAGQGGTGIQSAPGAGATVASLIRAEPLPTPLDDYGVTASNLSPNRFRT
jgi:D-arginine dehydrogenase